MFICDLFFYFPFSLDFCFMNIGILHVCIVCATHMCSAFSIQRRASNPQDCSYMTHHIDSSYLPLGEKLVLLNINLPLHPLYFHVYTSLKLKYCSRIVNTWRLLEASLFGTVHHLSQNEGVGYCSNPAILRSQQVTPVAIYKTTIRMICRW